MTQSSAFWDEVPAVGDVSLSPYDAAAEFSSIFSQILASDGDGYVIPSYLNNLNVTAQSPAAAGVAVNTGAAFVKGWRYLSDASENLTIDGNASGNPRIDRVVLRIDWAAKTVRLAVLKGTAAAAPSAPALTQTFGTTWEVSLAYVWVANGFATIANTEIFDERQFALTMKSIQVSNLGKNLIANSEFMAMSNPVGATVTSPPWRWVPSATTLTFAIATRPAQMVRGRAVTIGTGAGSMSQTFSVKPSTAYSLRGLLRDTNATSLTDVSVTITTNSASPQTKTIIIPQIDVWYDLRILYITEADASTMTISFNAPATGTAMVGQWMCIEGYISGPYREFSEIIESDVLQGGTYNNQIEDTNWNGDAKSDGTTTIDLTSDYAGYVLPGTKAVKFFLQGNDSGSAAATSCVFTAGPPSSNIAAVLDLAGVPNDVVKKSTGWSPVSPSHSLSFFIEASGAGTFDMTAYIIGIRT